LTTRPGQGPCMFYIRSFHERRPSEDGLLAYQPSNDGAFIKYISTY
jgi:hypothetical protein